MFIPILQLLFQFLMHEKRRPYLDEAVRIVLDGQPGKKARLQHLLSVSSSAAFTEVRKTSRKVFFCCILATVGGVFSCASLTGIVIWVIWRMLQQ